MAEAPETPEYAKFASYWRGVRNQVIGVGAGILLFYLAIDVVFFPWDYRWPGHPPLTDDWHGEVVVNGRPSRFVFRLDSTSSGKRDMGKALIVDAKLCDAARSREFHGTSKPRGWAGASFATSLAARDERSSGIRSIQLEARWDRADALEVRARLADQPGTVTTYEGAPASDPTIVTTTLRRGAASARSIPCEIH